MDGFVEVLGCKYLLLLICLGQLEENVYNYDLASNVPYNVVYSVKHNCSKYVIQQCFAYE